MGCDIHLYVEVHKDNQWCTAHQWVIEDGWFTTNDNRFDPDRNYRLFAMLANVRNGYGFGGVDTGDELHPIDEPRGLPDDLAPETYQMAQSWSDDGHSHSWFTVQELLDYNWTQTVVERGVVDALTFWDWNRGGEYSGRSKGDAPESWAGDVSGGNVVKLSEQELLRRFEQAFAGETNYRKQAEIIKEQLENVYCRASWTQKYYQMASYFLSHVLPELLALGDPENVRIVFWFDN